MWHSKDGRQVLPPYRGRGWQVGSRRSRSEVGSASLAAESAEESARLLNNVEEAPLDGAKGESASVSVEYIGMSLPNGGHRGRLLRRALIHGGLCYSSSCSV